ncbi:hypothetical protein RJ641_013013, partial [Dillenia turbinata]
QSQCVRDFDKHATRFIAKFKTVDAYYRHSSSVNFVEDVSVPLLCISAVNDPVCTGEAIPYDECRNNQNVVLATTKHGGHLAYYEGITATSMWWVRAVDEFLSVLHSSPFVLRKKEVQPSSSPGPSDPSVDQVPFVNIMKDGEVAVPGSEQRNGEVEDAHHEHLMKTTEDKNTSPGMNPSNTMTAETNALQKDLAEDPKQDSYNPSQPITRSIGWVARHCKISVWVLAYIAIVTSWPVLGSALSLIFKRKFRNNTLKSFSGAGKLHRNS